MSMIVTGGATDVTTYFAMRLLTGGDGTGLTIADFDMQYVRTRATPAAKVDATALAAANTAHTDNFGIEVDATDTPGLYRFDWPDAAFAAGVAEVILTVKHTSCFTESLRVAIDPFGAPAGASLSADLAAIKSDSAAILVDTGTTLDGRIPAALVSGRMDASVGAMAANVITAAALAADAGNEIADAWLDRDMSTGADSGSTTVRTPRQSLRVLRNKVTIAAGTMTVNKEDDTTASWTAAVTGTAGADPITSIDPAGP